MPNPSMSRAWFSGDALPRLRQSGGSSRDQRARARLAAARLARDADDLRLILDMLELWPADDPPPRSERSVRAQRPS